MYEWAGRILRIDLSSGKIAKEPLDKTLIENYIGGRGINSKILYDEVRPEIDGFSPENRLIFGTGPLSGTKAPSSGRCTVSGKSPLTGILGDSNFGGFFGPELKFAGYDQVVIQGKADKPVYLWIEDDRVEIKPAGHLWGKTTWETETAIKQELNDSKLHIASIGPAGENLVRIACIISDSYRAAGRTGMGAIMGSKNLKAVAVRGTEGVKIAKPETLSQLSKNLIQRIKKNPSYPMFSRYGTSLLTALVNDVGILEWKNFQKTGEYEGIDKISHEVLDKQFFTKSKACFGCPIHCSHYFEVKEGPYKGERGEGIEYGVIGGFGSRCGNSYAPSLFKILNLVNQLGIDAYDASGIMGSALEWYEKGIISKKDTDGVALEWGNYESLIEMIQKIARREGFGDILAEGLVRASKKVEKEAEKYISHCKGSAIAMDDVRVAKGYALCLATSTRGADHLRGMPVIELTGANPEAEARFGNQVVILTSYEKVPAVFYYQNICTAIDAMQLCKYASEWYGQEIGMKDMADLFSAVTGIEIDVKHITKVAERIFSLERAFLVREGITREDDFLKGKVATEPISSGPFKGEKLEHEKFALMLNKYYQKRGWNENGIPTRTTLEDLGLKEIAIELQEMGKVHQKLSLS